MDPEMFRGICIFTTYGILTFAVAINSYLLYVYFRDHTAVRAP